MRKLVPLLSPAWWFAVALAGSAVTSGNMGWYRTIATPAWTPAGGVIGAVWTTLFLLAAISGVLLLRAPRTPAFPWLVAAFLANGALNALWSWLFFGWHLLGLAALEAGVLGVSVLVMIALAWRVSRTAAWLLVPYAAWVGFATYLAATIWGMNRG